MPVAVLLGFLKDEAIRAFTAQRHGTQQARHVAVTLATDVSRGSGLEPVGGLMGKRALRNRGWHQSFIDKRRRDEFLRDREAADRVGPEERS